MSLFIDILITFMTINILYRLMADQKIKLHRKCLEIAEQKVNELSIIIQETQDAANNETKSSAGDKHETGRAMAQLETEKLSKQLSEALKIEQTLTQTNPNTEHQKVGLGSLITTNNGIFYLSVSLGKLTLNELTYFIISPASPIGKLLTGLTINASFSFNGKRYQINKII
jgi:transcription elongation GreA/GreB family factor